MNHIQNRLTVAIIATLALLVFGSPHTSQAAPNPIEPDQFSCTDVSEIPQNECEALVALYNFNTNPPYGWLETTMPCSWSRVLEEESIELTWTPIVF